MQRSLLFFVFSFMLGKLLFAQSPDKTYPTDRNGTTVAGYDLVAYFNAEHPVKGSAHHAAAYQGRTYWFSSEDNKIKFLATPEQYLPQYGGWCAYAMARGDQVEINPRAYLIQEEKLYLFYKTSWINTRIKWLKEPKALQAKADLHWRQ